MKKLDYYENKMEKLKNELTAKIEYNKKPVQKSIIWKQK